MQNVSEYCKVSVTEATRMIEFVLRVTDVIGARVKVRPMKVMQLL